MDENTPKHTQEPWQQFAFGEVKDGTSDKDHSRHIARFRSPIDAARAVECVNAMAGVTNPSGYVKRARELAQKYNEQLETIADLQARNESLHQRIANQAETIRGLRDQLGNDNPPFPPTEQLLREGNA